MANKLQRADVVNIRKLLLEGRYTTRQIANAYNVGTETIRRVGRGDTWGENQMKEQAEFGPSALLKMRSDASQHALVKSLQNDGLDHLIEGTLPPTMQPAGSPPPAYAPAPAADTREAVEIAGKITQDVTRRHLRPDIDELKKGYT